VRLPRERSPAPGARLIARSKRVPAHRVLEARILRAALKDDALRAPSSGSSAPD